MQPNQPIYSDACERVAVSSAQMIGARSASANLPPSHPVTARLHGQLAGCVVEFPYAVPGGDQHCHGCKKNLVRKSGLQWR